MSVFTSASLWGRLGMHCLPGQHHFYRIKYFVVQLIFHIVENNLTCIKICPRWRLNAYTWQGLKEKPHHWLAMFRVEQPIVWSNCFSIKKHLSGGESKLVSSHQVDDCGRRHWHPVSGSGCEVQDQAKWTGLGMFFRKGICGRPFSKWSYLQKELRSVP